MTRSLVTPVQARACARLLTLSAVLTIGCDDRCVDTYRSTKALVPLVCEGGATVSFEHHAGEDWVVCRCPHSLDGGAR